jgi:hypothetical protein
MVLLLKEKRAKTVSERIFHAGENPRVFGSTNLILFSAFPLKNGGNPCLSEGLTRVQVNEELLADQALSFE